MFRGKESSNRIELSRLVQELLNFGVSGSLWLWGVGGWVDRGRGWLGVPPTDVHMHTHAHMHTHTHVCMVNMIISCKWLSPLGESMGIPYDVICMCTCMHVHMHVCGGHPLTTPYPHLPTPYPPEGGPRNQSKFNSTWTNRDISILFKDLKSVETSPPKSGCIVWSVGGWVGGLMGGVRSNH